VRRCTSCWRRAEYPLRRRTAARSAQGQPRSRDQERSGIPSAESWMIQVGKISWGCPSVWLQSPLREQPVSANSVPASRACQTYRAISHKVRSDTQFSLWLLSLMPLGARRKIGACGGRAPRSASCRSRRSPTGKASGCPSGPSPFRAANFAGVTQCTVPVCKVVQSPIIANGEGR
jgi:hypothetical protein